MVAITNTPKIVDPGRLFLYYIPFNIIRMPKKAECSNSLTHVFKFALSYVVSNIGLKL